MPFLKEVLATKEEAIITDLKLKVPYLTSHIEKLKYEVKEYIENKNNLLAPRNICNKLCTQSNDLNIEMDELTEKIKEVTRSEIGQSVLDIDKLNIELQETVYALKLTTQLVNIYEALKTAEQLEKNKNYVESIYSFEKAKKIIDNIPNDEQLELVKKVLTNIKLEKNLVVGKIVELWEENVKIDKTEKDDMTIISIKINNKFNLQEIISVLYQEESYEPFNNLSDFLLNDILIPIINRTVNVVNKDDNSFILNVKIKNNSNKMNYKAVFSNIMTVFGYCVEKLEYKFGEVSLLSYIGNKIRDEFSEIFIKNCLSDTVPSTQEELEKYEDIVADLHWLQNLLTEGEFFNENSKQIIEYVENVNQLYAEKICKNYLDKAVTIFKKDLHDMVEIGNVENQSPENQKINNFPKCYVSRSACEILNLARTILDQVNTSSELCAGHLLYTCKEIFRHYGADVPIIHKKLLDTIPQQVALFHNNCLYFSHELMRYNDFYIEKFMDTETFDIQIEYLRTIGTEAFLNYKKSQIKQIEDILNDSELANLGQVEKLDTNCEKNLRQCLRQLELLKTVWQKVLTYEIYNKTMGELLNSFINHLIKLVLVVEDISAETSTMLVEMFNVIKTRGPKLFTEPKEINLYTKHWYKFTELILLLSSNLSNILDRWADRKGPLAVAYTPADVRRLIRALFQNTDQRAAVLAKIN